MINPRDQAWYSIFKAKDTRFDGHFFVGVSSTGIYCRPVCQAKLPKVENCSFYNTAAAAEQAGYRPCLLCRPELAPGNAPIDAKFSLAQRAMQMLEEQCGSEDSLEEIALRLGYTGRHLRRVFVAEYNVTPVQYIQTCRLLLAKNLLTNTSIPIIDVAMAAGFGSLRRFNDLFQKRYRMPPTALRKQTNLDAQDNHPTLSLGYRPPYPWEQMLSFLASRAIPGVETVTDGEYRRTAYFVTPEQKHLQGWIRIGHKLNNHTLSVTIDSTLLPVLPQILARIRHLFDLTCNPDAIYEALSSMNTIRPGLCVKGTRLPGCFDSFEMAVRAILGQQITVKAARTLAGRMVKAFGTPVQTGITGLTHLFPAPQVILSLGHLISNHLGPLGITAARANTIHALAHSLERGELDFSVLSQPKAEIEKLLLLPGIGAWTANYIAMRGLGWPDAFPHTDHGVKKALEPRTEKEILALAEMWRPWRGYATINLWNSL